ncbi:MAG: hypothetical protein EOP50_15460, partial [Sphingobacteriales bacterium]
MQVDARDGSAGVVARQLLVLTAGTYIMHFKASPAEGATLAASRFEILCLPARSRIAQAPLADASGRSRYSLRFTVPASCDRQTLEVALASGRTDASIEG